MYYYYFSEEIQVKCSMKYATHVHIYLEVGIGIQRPRGTHSITQTHNWMKPQQNTSEMTLLSNCIMVSFQRNMLQLEFYDVFVKKFVQ